MKNLILIFGFVTIAVIVIAVVFKPAPSSENQPASVNSSVSVLGSSSYDFGVVSMAKGEVTRDFRIKNNSTGKVEIKKIYTSCMCTTAWFINGKIEKGPFGMAGHGYVPPVKEYLGSGEEAVIKVVFDPTAHGPAGVGPIQRAIYIEGADSMLAQLEFSANVAP